MHDNYEIREIVRKIVVTLSAWLILTSLLAVFLERTVKTIKLFDATPAAQSGGSNAKN